MGLGGQKKQRNLRGCMKKRGGRQGRGGERVSREGSVSRERLSAAEYPTAAKQFDTLAPLLSPYYQNTS